MKRTDDYVMRNVSGIPLLISTSIPRNGCWMYELNSVGKLIWERCDRCNSVDAVIEELDMVFNSPLTCEQKKAVMNYCDTLIRLGMLKDEI